MTFPQLKNKYLETALINPKQFVDYEGLSRKKVPKKIILVYQKSSENYFKRKYRNKVKTLKFIRGYKIYSLGDVGLIKVAGIGAPNATVVLEELISLGAKEFISIGTAGGLTSKGIYLCNEAIRDEGTSHHYISHGKKAYPDTKLTNAFEKSLRKRKISFEIAPTWTIDAPYRETEKEIEKYRKEGVATVEMEASALFAVAKIRKVKIASAFAVSDTLIKKWDPMFHQMNMKLALHSLIESAVECLKERK